MAQALGQNVYPLHFRLNPMRFQLDHGFLYGLPESSAANTSAMAQIRPSIEICLPFK